MTDVNENNYLTNIILGDKELNQEVASMPNAVQQYISSRESRE